MFIGQDRRSKFAILERIFFPIKKHRAKLLCHKRAKSVQPFRHDTGFSWNSMTPTPTGHPHEDPRRHVRRAISWSSWQVQRHADILATILARMSTRKSVWVLVSWDASFMKHIHRVAWPWLIPRYHSVAQVTKTWRQSKTVTSSQDLFTPYPTLLGFHFLRDMRHSRLCYEPDVRPSVCLSITVVDCDHIVQEKV